jgi:hypothetical protein
MSKASAFSKKSGKGIRKPKFKPSFIQILYFANKSIMFVKKKYPQNQSFTTFEHVNN